MTSRPFELGEMISIVFYMMGPKNSFRLDDISSYRFLVSRCFGKEKAEWKSVPRDLFQTRYISTYTGWKYAASPVHLDYLYIKV